MLRGASVSAWDRSIQPSLREARYPRIADYVPAYLPPGKNHRMFQNVSTGVFTR